MSSRDAFGRPTDPDDARDAAVPVAAEARAAESVEVSRGATTGPAAAADGSGAQPPTRTGLPSGFLPMIVADALVVVVVVVVLVL